MSVSLGSIKTRDTSAWVLPQLISVVTASFCLGAALVAVVSEYLPIAPVTVAMTALLAGLIVPVLAAWSVLRREPVFVTAADRFTLGRGVLAGGCATLAVLVAAGFLPPQSWPLVLLAAPAAALDAADGWVARRTGTSNAYGARLDMETDAALLMILSVPAAYVVGSWVLLIGAMRYLFVAASWFRPTLKGELRYSTFRRVVAAVQSVALVGVLVPFIPHWLATLMAGTAMLLLLISFTKDIRTLELAARRS